MPKVLSLAWETILEIELAFEYKHCQPEDILELFQRLQNDVQNIHEELGMYINTPNWDRPIVFYDDDDDQDYAIAVTPSLSTEEPDNSLNDGSNGDGIGGGDGHADRAVHLARRSFVEGGDSEVIGDGGGVGMARSLSTSTSGGRDMAA
nr:hypothetical protein [Tanacetum cinerariifolium]